MTEDKTKLTDENQVTEVEEADAVDTEAEIEESETIEDTSATLQSFILPGVTATDFNNLTNKSQQFMIGLDKQLGDQIRDEIKEHLYKEIVDTLQEGQLTGQTAKHLYGTPTEAAKTILEQEYAELIKEQEAANVSPDWQLAMDGGLMLGSLFTIITGISMLTADESAASSTTYMGLVTLIINYVIAGVSMLMATKSMPDMDAPKGKRGLWKYFGISILSMLLWFSVVAVSAAIIPPQFNPTFSAEVYLIIGVATMVLRFILKKQLNIQGTIM